MILSASQPRYLPWMGYFDRIAKSDVHVVLDHVTLSKGDFVNRCQIMQRDGRPMWLTIPCEKGKPINETRTAGDGWRKKHRHALSQAYGMMFRYPETDMLLDILAPLTDQLFREFRITTPVLLSSEMDTRAFKSDLVLGLCREVGADVYLSGPHGKNYLDLPAFDKAGVEVIWHNYPVVHPVLSAVHDLFGEKHAQRPIAC